MILTKTLHLRIVHRANKPALRSCVRHLVLPKAGLLRDASPFTTNAQAPSRKRGRFGRAVTELENGNYEKAIEIVHTKLNTLVENDNKTPSATSVFSTYDALGKPTGGAESANEVLQDILKLRKENSRRRFLTGEENRKPLPYDDIQTVVDAAISRANDGAMEANVFLGDLYFGAAVEDGQVTEKDAIVHGMLSKCGLDTSEAVGRYFAAAKSAMIPEAWTKLGSLHFNGVGDLGIPRDAKLCRMFMEKAANEEEPAALFWLGTYYHQGDPEEGTDFDTGIRPDQGKAMDFLRKAAIGEHSSAMVYLAKIYLTESQEPNKHEEARVLLDRAAALEDGEALHLLGDMYMEEGRDGGESLKTAKGLYERACESGIADACVSAGAMHFQGIGTEEDASEAYLWYQKGAKFGSLDAWKCIASQHYFGQGVPEDREMAEEIIQFIKDMEKKPGTD